MLTHIPKNYEKSITNITQSMNSYALFQSSDQDRFDAHVHNSDF